MRNKSFEETQLAEKTELKEKERGEGSLLVGARNATMQ